MPDPEFVRRLESARAGDEVAFTALFRSVQPALLRYLGVMTRGLPGSSADDVASDTWLQVVRGLHRFRGGEDGFRAWVFAIARARLIDARRRGRRLAMPAETDVLLADAAAAVDVAASVEELMSTEAALRLVSRLPAVQAEVVLLRYVAGLDVEHTARLVGKRPGTVRVTAHRALRCLEAWLPADTTARPRQLPVTPSDNRTVWHSR